MIYVNEESRLIRRNLEVQYAGLGLPEESMQEQMCKSM